MTMDFFNKNNNNNKTKPAGQVYFALVGPVAPVGRVSFRSRNHLTWSGMIVLLISALFLGECGGCRRGASNEDQQRTCPESKTLKGPVEMVVRADRSKARIAEGITLWVEVRALTGVGVKFPQTGKKLGPFEVMKVDDSPDVPVDGGKGRFWTRTFTLESLKSGKLKIPAVTVDFTDNRKPAEPIHSQITSKELELQIASLLESKADPTKFRDIKGAVELPAEPTYAWVWMTAGGLGLAGLVLGIVLLIIRAKRNRALTADQWALGRLGRLISDGLIEAGQIERFYVRLTNIVREYIERRFTIHAPNLTTREFLTEAHSHHKLEEYHEKLRENLQSADMVKFARFQPSEAESFSAMETARRFIIASAVKKEI